MCPVEQAPLLAAAKAALGSWRTAGLRVTRDTWQAHMAPLVQTHAAAGEGGVPGKNSVVTQLVVVWGGRVYLPAPGRCHTAPHADSPAPACTHGLYNLHEWLTGMLLQLARAASRSDGVSTHPLPFLLTTQDWAVAPKATYPQPVPVFGCHAVAVGGGPGGLGAWDVAVPGGTLWWQYRDQSRGMAAYLTKAAVIAESVPWHNRLPVALFRGSLTCPDYGSCDCPRARLVHASQAHPHLLDVAIVESEDNPPRHAAAVCESLGLLPANDSLLLAPPLPLTQHVHWRYLLAVDGNSYSYRLQSLLPLASAVLKQESPYSEFYYAPALQPWVHYLPFSCGPGTGGQEPCAGAMEAVRWAREHDDLAAAIGAAGARFASTHLTPSGMDCYWVTLLQEYGRDMVEADAVTGAGGVPDVAQAAAAAVQAAASLHHVTRNQWAALHAALVAGGWEWVPPPPSP